MTPTSETPSDAAPEAPSERAAGAAVVAAADAEGGWVTAAPPRAVEIVQRVVGFPNLVRTHGDLIVTSVQRELRGQFTGTLLGWFWPLISPLFMFAVYYFIFTKLLQFKMPDLPAGQEAAMGVFMFVGILVWSGFSESLVRGTSVIVDNGNLIKKVAFPSEILPLNVTLTNLVTMLFGMAVYVIGSAFVWELPDPHRLWWIPILLVLQALFTYGVALFLATLYVFLRDIQQIVTIVVTVWMFMTPIFWVPEAISGIEPYLPLIEANPLYHLVYGWRVVLMSAEPGFVFGPPMAPSVGIFAVWAVAAYALGYAFFSMAKRRFADEV